MTAATIVGSRLTRAQHGIEMTSGSAGPPIGHTADGDRRPQAIAAIGAPAAAGAGAGVVVVAELRPPTEGGAVVASRLSHVSKPSCWV